MRELHGQMRHYPWGSRTLLAELTGRVAPSAEPEAEIWYGAHPAEPCQIGADAPGEGRSLAQVIAADPSGQLGEQCAQRFEGELPFLLKLLAAGEPLSLQAHPSAEQARAGFARENALGIPPGDPKRNYKDPRHKPELLVALTDFEALAGFAEAERTRALLRELGVVQLPAEGLWDLRETVAAWTRLSPLEAAPLVARMGAAAVGLAGEAGEFAAHAKVIALLAAKYPQDPGVLIASLLNYVRLEPGAGMFIPAGVLHAHLGGLGVEIMANSDNVLRGGLTAKHVDVDELFAVVDFTPTSLDRLLVAGAQAGPWREFVTGVEEFALGSALLAQAGDQVVEPSASGPRIVLCAKGSALVQVQGRTRLGPAEAGWLAAGDAQAIVTAEEPDTQVFFARVP